MAFTLEPQKLEALRAAIRAVQEAEDICRQGEAAGYDMSPTKIPCAYYRERLQAILDNFSPKRIE